GRLAGSHRRLGRGPGERSRRARRAVRPHPGPVGVRDPIADGDVLAPSLAGDGTDAPTPCPGRCSWTAHPGGSRLRLLPPVPAWNRPACPRADRPPPRPPGTDDLGRVDA